MRRFAVYVAAGLLGYSDLGGKDPREGFLSPGRFEPAFENHLRYQQIYTQNELKLEQQPLPAIKHAGAGCL
jgi:hypothetical protein